MTDKTIDVIAALFNHLSLTIKTDGHAIEIVKKQVAKKPVVKKPVPKKGPKQMQMKFKK